MEKLIELIIQFQKEIWQTTYDLDMYHYDNKLKLIVIWSDISKWFIDYIDIFRLLFAPWFIKWLVDNDKIDFYTILKENWTFRKEFYAIENKKEYERLIMLLSVEDNPIEFLISILK